MSLILRKQTKNTSERNYFIRLDLKLRYINDGKLIAAFRSFFFLGFMFLGWTRRLRKSMSELKIQVNVG